MLDFLRGYTTKAGSAPSRPRLRTASQPILWQKDLCAYDEQLLDSIRTDCTRRLPADVLPAAPDPYVLLLVEPETVPVPELVSLVEPVVPLDDPVVPAVVPLVAPVDDPVVEAPVDAVDALEVSSVPRTSIL